MLPPEAVGEDGCPRCEAALQLTAPHRDGAIQHACGVARIHTAGAPCAFLCLSWAKGEMGGEGFRVRG